MKKKDYTMQDVDRYHQLLDEFAKTMPFGQALEKAQQTIKKTLQFRRKMEKEVGLTKVTLVVVTALLMAYLLLIII